MNVQMSIDDSYAQLGPRCHLLSTALFSYLGATIVVVMESTDASDQNSRAGALDNGHLLFYPPGQLDRLHLRLTPHIQGKTCLLRMIEESNPISRSICLPECCIVPLMGKSSHYDLITPSNVDTTSCRLKKHGILNSSLPLNSMDSVAFTHTT